MTDDVCQRFQMVTAQWLRDLADKLETGQRDALKVEGRRNEDGTFTFSVTHAATPESRQGLVVFNDFEGNHHSISVEHP